jgi:hypothetical protein
MDHPLILGEVNREVLDGQQGFDHSRSIPNDRDSFNCGELAVAGNDRDSKIFGSGENQSVMQFGEMERLGNPENLAVQINKLVIVPCVDFL